MSKRAQRARWLPSGPIVISSLKINWDLFLLKNRNLKKVSIPASVSGDVLHPLVPSLRKTSDGRAPVRERLNDTEQVQEAANAHLGSRPPDGPSYKTVCRELWIILGVSQRPAGLHKPCVRGKNRMLSAGFVQLLWCFKGSQKAKQHRDARKE